MKVIRIEAERLADRTTRRSWIYLSGQPGTVEEITREYYLRERKFSDCLIDSACVYGGLAWVLFHDILFHNNLNSKQPLCSLFLNKPQDFYDKHRIFIEEKLIDFHRHPNEVFDDGVSRFCSHRFFCDSTSKIAEYYGEWIKRNKLSLRDVAVVSAKHNLEFLIREIIVKSNKGRNRGWPDLVVWSTDEIIFAEVKSSDKLSREQILWISEHNEKITTELVWVVPI